MKEHHIEVRKTARYWTLGDVSAADEVWFVLHGYRQLARRFIRRFESIATPNRAIVAPEALSRFYVSSGEGRHGAASVVGATWMTREDRANEIADYVGYLDRLAETLVEPDPKDGEGAGGRTEGVSHNPRIVVLGFSQGVATATRWAVHGRVRPARLLLWGDFTPPDLDLERAARALATVEMVTVRGTSDRALSHRLAEEEASRLLSTGLEVRAIRYEGGHDIDLPTLESLAAS